MKTYTIHTQKNAPLQLEEAIFVKEGFSWLGGLFPVLWSAYHKMWIYSIIFLILQISFVLLAKYEILNPQILNIVNILFFVLVGFGINDWYRKNLSNKNYRIFDIVIAKGTDEAKQKFFEEYAKNTD